MAQRDVIIKGGDGLTGNASGGDLLLSGGAKAGTGVVGNVKLNGMSFPVTPGSNKQALLSDGTNLYFATLTYADFTGAVNATTGAFSGALTQGGYQTLNANNYTNYAAIGTGYTGTNDLNTVLISGMYRQDVPSANGSGYSYSPLLVMRGTFADTVSQLIVDYSSGNVKTRGASGIGGTPAWSPWRQLLSDANYNSYSPTLTGGNASGTWAISITGNASGTAQNANTLGGLALQSASTAPSANQVIRSDGNGYTYHGWINTVSGDNGTNPISRVYASGDSFLRYYSLANFSAQLTGGAPNLTAGAANTSYAVASTNGQQNGDGWWRSTGNTGWYSTSYNVGIYSTSAGLVQTYNSSSMQVNGVLYATNNIVAYYSDMRLKTKIRNIDNAVDKVKQLSGFIYVNNNTANAVGYTSDAEQVGLSAQEVELVMPQLVSHAPFDIGRNEDGTEYSISGEHYKTVDYAKLVPLLVEAIKEQQAQLDYQQTQIDELKSLFNR